MKQPGGTQGFTLFELSIVIAIIALVTGMAVQSGITVISTARLTATQKKMKAIDDALMQFRLFSNRLPCPSDLALTPGTANYGLEAGEGAGSAIGTATGVCTGTGMLPQANNTAAGITNTFATAAEGALPAVTLGLPPDLMADGWGNKFRYAVDISYTVPGVFTGTGLGCTFGAITVNDSNATARTTGAIYALISHGGNGHGAYPVQGSVMVNAGSTNANEQTNCHCNSSAAVTSYAPTYVQMQATLDSATVTDNFDDLVTFKERWQMRTDWDRASCGYIYIADNNNSRVRMVSLSTGIITTVAGSGAFNDSGDGGLAINAGTAWPGMVAVDSSGNMYWADYYDDVVRKVTASTGIINQMAGVVATPGYTGDGGSATSAEFNYPVAVAVDSGGNVYVVDQNNVRIRKIAAGTGIITTVAGNGTTGFSGDGGAATSAEFNYPTYVSVDGSGNFYIADAVNARIRKVTVATGIITTVAGNGTPGFSGDGGLATSAELLGPGAVAFDSSGNMYITDSNNFRVRKVTTSTGVITTYAGNGTQGYSGDNGLATSAELNYVGGIAFDSSNNLYIADWNNNVIRKVTATTGIITTVAGTGVSNYSGDGGPATSATLSEPEGVAFGVR